MNALSPNSDCSAAIKTNKNEPEEKDAAVAEPPLKEEEVDERADKQARERKKQFHELAELLGTSQDPAELSAYLYDRFPSLGALLTTPLAAWEKVAVAGTQFPIMLQVLRECALRHNRACLPNDDLCADERKLMDYLIARLAWESVEHFHVLFLDEKNHLIADELQSVGTINHAPVYPREIALRCLALKARAVILAHNHPSGDATPSLGDVAMTQKVQSVLSVLDIKLLDHYVIGRANQSSFIKLGLL